MISALKDYTFLMPVSDYFQFDYMLKDWKCDHDSRRSITVPLCSQFPAARAYEHDWQKIVKQCSQDIDMYLVDNCATG